MYKKLIFFNHGHLGDTLLSKPFIKEIKKYIKAESYIICNAYDNSYTSDIFDDHIHVSKLNIDPSIWAAEDDDNNLYFNTWYGVVSRPENLKMRQIDASEWKNCTSDDGILYNWENYLFWFNKCLKMYDSNLSIDYMSKNKTNYIKDLQKYDVSHIPFINDKRMKILIFNQIATSGQADNEDFSSYIKTLSENKDIIIYTSQNSNLESVDNVVNLQDYISYPDLDVVAYLSKYCKIISGPGNAPIINTWSKDNLEDHNKVYITINRNNKGEAIWFKESKCKNIVVNSTNRLFNEIYNII